MTKIIINTDGGSRGNPGPGAIGIVIQDEQRNVLQITGANIGVATNNEAEYIALQKGLELVLNITKDKVECYMDSELVCKQMNGEYKIKANNIIPLHNSIKKLEQQFDNVKYIHVKRDDNYQKKADKLVNIVLDN